MNHHKLQLLLSAFVDDELLPDEQSEVEQHLVHCSDCRHAVVEMQTIRKDIRRAATIEITPMATSNLLRAIRLASDPQVVWGGTEIFARRLIVALTLLVFCIVSIGSLNKPEQPIVMESYLSGEASDSTAHRVLSQGEVSKEDILLAVTTR
jgi:anti-sigma factor RsiW